jgi:signal transduction histidine kinase
VTWEKIKHNHLIILSFLAFVVMVGLILFEIDKQYYQSDKKNIIIENWTTIFPEDWETREHLIQYSKELLNQRDTPLYQAAEAQFTDYVSRIVASNSPMYRFSVLDANKQELISIGNDKKIAEFNNFHNSLFLRNFAGKSNIFISDATGKNIIGRLIVSYTTPPDYPPIMTLTERYRFYSLGIIILLSLIYAYILKYLLLPVRRVIVKLDKTSYAPAEIIGRPASLLERLYNNIARDALLTLVSRRIRDFTASSTALNPLPILSDLPDVISKLFSFKAVFLFEIKRDPAGRYVTTSTYQSQSPVAEQSLLPLRTEIERVCQITPSAILSEKLSKAILELEVGGKKCQVFTDLIAERDSFQTVILFAAIPRLRDERTFDVWNRETLERLSEQVRSGLETIELYRQTIFKEKSEANISLSRNLGHDLTNIIATSKLDLMTVRDFLAFPKEEILTSNEKETIFKESLQGLLNNTKFLQELVDIYRSFSFIKRPKFENTDVNELLQEIIGIFQLSLSKTVAVTTRFKADLPRCRIERRLIKLAIFNLLTNAVDAIKRRSSSIAAEGEITIATNYAPDTNEIVISVRDTGDGIRNEKGELAEPLEIDKIFYMGYTTKRDDEGEGLGLNWVWTIVNDFHKGRIIPRNVEGGGAEFTIMLKAIHEKSISQTAAKNISRVARG